MTLVEVERAYRADAGRVLSVVRGVVGDVGAETIEDACQDAWLALIGNSDRIEATDARQLSSYVIKTAIRRGWRLAARTNGTCELERELPDRLDVEERVIARDALRLAGVAERQRQMLFLHALGFTYAEIAAATGSTIRSVDRQLQRGRRRLRA